jgi:hypothetical protein
MAGTVISWVGQVGESLTESLPESTKEQVKELAGNLGEVTKEKLGSIAETTTELAGNLSEVTKEKFGTIAETTTELAGNLGEVTKDKLATLGVPLKPEKLLETTKEIAEELGEAANQLAIDMNKVAKEHVKELAGGYGDAIRVRGKVHRFQSSNGTIEVVEQGAMSHGLRILVSRAQCSTSDTLYDLRRLRVGGGDGFVELGDLLKLEREVQLMDRLKPHPHVVQCHATLVENWGKQH